MAKLEVILPDGDKDVFKDKEGSESRDEYARLSDDYTTFVWYSLYWRHEYEVGPDDSLRVYKQKLERKQGDDSWRRGQRSEVAYYRPHQWTRARRVE